MTPQPGACGIKPRRAGAHYALIQGLYWSLMAVYMVFGAAYLYDIGLSSLQTGIVFAAAGAVSALIQPLLARRADRAARPGMVRRIACLLMLPACGLLALLWLCPLPLALRVCLYAPVWMLLMTVQFLLNALAMEYPNAGLRLNYGVGRALGSFGFALAAWLYGLFVARFDTAALLPVGFGLALLLLLAVSLWRSPPAAPRESRDIAEAGFFRRYPRFLLLVCGTALCMTPYSMVCNFLVRIVESVGGGSVELGTATMLAALCEIPVMFLSLRLNRRCGSYALMLVAAGMLTLKMLLFTLARSVSAVYAAELVQLLGYPLLMCVSVYYVNARMAARDRVRGQAMMALTQTVASAAGALLGGLLIDGLGVRGLLLVSLGISAAGSLVMALGTERVASPG
ncbi:MAG: MFS transporter [Clostridia bacterium]|nr:MFS transporter [Clostridia bacterium]